MSVIGLQQKSFAKIFLLFPQLYIIVFFERRRSETCRLSMNKGASAKIMGSQGKSEKFPNY